MSVRSTSIVRAVAEHLASRPEIQARLTNGSVEAHRHTDVPDQGVWVRLTVRELNAGGQADRPGAVPVMVQVVAECHGHPDPDLALEALLEACHTALLDHRPDTDHGDAILAATRRRRPTPALYEAKTASFISAALYEVATL